MYVRRKFVDAGGLMSYGAKLSWLLLFDSLHHTVVLAFIVKAIHPRKQSQPRQSFLISEGLSVEGMRVCSSDE